LKSRREVLSGLITDLAKAMFITLVIGKIANPEIIGWYAMSFGIVLSILMVVLAIKIHPRTKVDKEFNL